MKNSKFNVWLAGFAATAMLLTPAAAQASEGSTDGSQESWTGTVLVAPSEEQGEADTVVLQTPDETIELVGDIPPVASGQMYQVTGEAVGAPGEPDVDVTSVQPVDPGAASAAMAAPAAPGDRSVVVVGVDVPGGSFQGSYGAAQAQAAVKDADAYFARSTNDAFGFRYAGFVPWSNTPVDLTPVGVQNVTSFTNTNRCDISVVHRVAVYMAAQAGYNIGTTTVAAMTDNTCGPIGQGWINVPGIAMYAYGFSDGLAHELGHNLGLGHSGVGYCLSGAADAGPISHCTSFADEHDEYGDFGTTGDVMGYSFYEAATTAGVLGPVHLEELGLLTDLNTVTVPYQQPGTGDTVTIQSAELEPLSGSAMDAFVAKAYKDVLRRTPAPDDQGVRGWSDAIQAGQFTRAQFADAIVYSTESTMNHAGDLYREIMQRQPDLQGQQGWAAEIASKRLSLKDARAVYWASDERFWMSRSSNRQWVSDLYRMELKRDPEPAGLAGWVGVLDSGVWNRTQVAQAFVDCPECATKAVTRAYQEYLGRNPDPVGLAGWVSIYPWSDYLILTVNFVASQEYYNKAVASAQGLNGLRILSPSSETLVALRNGQVGAWMRYDNPKFDYYDSVRYPKYLPAGSSYYGNLGVRLYVDSTSPTGANVRYQRQ